MKPVFNALQLAGLLVVLACSQAFAQQENELGWTMDSALDQLEKQGREFDTALADVEIEWTNRDGSTDKDNSGRIYQNKDGEVRIHIKAPQERTVLIRGSDVILYDPNKATVQEFSRTRDNRLEPYTVLGFSHTGSDLERDFLVTFIGEDEITNRRVLGLELTPKSDSDRAHVSNIKLWIDQASWLPVRQIITHTPSGQSITITYSGTARNLKLNPDLFRDKWPKGTKKVRN
jgi:outer membrane lipoprotein-sorting protein